MDEALKPPAKKRGPPPRAREEAEKWLRAALAHGPRPAKDLIAAARKDGITEATLKRAKDALRIEGVESKKRGMKGKWVWQTPEANDEAGQ